MLAAICSFSSAFLSIVITFVLGDVLAVDKITAAISPMLSALCFWFAGAPMPDKSEGCVADWFEPAFLRGRMAAVVALLVVATLAKSFFDSGVGPVGEQGRMVKHIVGIVEVAGVMLLSFASTDARHFMVSVLYSWSSRLFWELVLSPLVQAVFCLPVLPQLFRRGCWQSPRHLRSVPSIAHGPMRARPVSAPWSFSFPKC